MTISWISAKSSIKWSGPLTDPADGLSSRCRGILRGVLVCFAALFCGGSPASGRPLSESNVPPRPGSPQPSQAYSANFHLVRPSGRTPAPSTDSGPGLCPFPSSSSRSARRPFGCAMTIPRITKGLLCGRSPSGSSSTNAFVWTVDQVHLQLFLLAHRTSELEKQLEGGLGMGYGQAGHEFLLSSLFRGRLFQFRARERISLLRIRAFCLHGQFDVGVFRGNDAAGV